MANWTRFKGINATEDGFAVGAKGSETVVVNSSGAVLAQAPLTVSFASASSAQTVYGIVPYAGTVTAVYVANDTASVVNSYTIKAGSAGNTIASGTATSGVAGLVSSLTLGTVTVTAGQSISFARATAGTTGSSTVTMVIVRTS